MENNYNSKRMSLQDLATDLLEQARRAGAHEADVFVSRGNDFEVNVRNGSVEVLKQAATKGLGLRVFVDHRMAFSHTTDFSPDALEKLVGDTVQMACHAMQDEHNGLPEQYGSVSSENLELFDPLIAATGTDAKLALAKEMERAALTEDRRVRVVETATYSDGWEEVLIANTRGFVGTYEATGCALVCSVVAVENEGKQMNYWYSNARYMADLEPAESVGRRAAQRAVRMLGARKIPSGQFPVVFDPLIASSFLSSIASALNGESIFRKTSFLTDRLGERIGSDAVTILDDGTLRRGLASRPFDGEGVPTSKKVVVEQGTLKTYLYDSYTARKAGTHSTGNAVRTYASTPRIAPLNFYLQPGTMNPDELIRRTPRGLYITGMIGFGVDTVTGQFSRGASGIWIENGELAYPVHEVTVASNMLEMLKNIELVGNDLEFRSNVASPTLKITEMSVSGT